MYQKRGVLYYHYQTGYNFMIFSGTAC